ncbi:hypothetical protein [Blastopirellula marina]|uniref:MoxR-vWA-beta-propeller ternary system domain-containing protein n=1 Tax=Blastopirellula marina TaxID=124 RepID=A0A2S8FN71_9BACT|nr:hypothetical protein [Blastopirellula marina]PQO33626.1 hypothetical protein C5Y98_15405 [Blastopirellula marina]PTL43413.1 hypothetical protein C5Y97_15415 [Blastopirellula marina]
MEVTLGLKYSPHVQRATTCWLVNSPAPQHWVTAAIAGFVGAEKHNTDQTHIRILPIPRSLHDSAAIGAVIVAGAAAKVTLEPPTTDCLPYGCLLDRVFLPIDARLEPEVSPEELQQLLSRERTYVWHPQAGLLAYEPNDILSVVDLIRPRPPQPTRFDQAQPGVLLPTRLVSLGPAEPPTMANVLQTGRDDIGTKGSDLTALPPHAGEPQPGVGANITMAGLKMLKAGLAGLNKLGSAIGSALQKGSAGGNRSSSGMGSGSNWLQQMQSWAQQRMEHLNQAFLSQREKELNRLMNLLETNPDEGLKYALPIGGDAHRGTAPPTGRLSQRNPNFNLSNLGGGGPADHWDLSWQHQQELLNRYRELANREINLGRYRRAAYIYAELLSDYQSAASTLKQGQHWREAAVLYQERLHQPLLAAECLKEGGLWTEAIELYVKLKEHEQAGDIHQRLDQQEEADAQYRLAVNACRARNDYLEAARLQEEKLDDTDAAIASLESAWPHTSQAIPGLTKLFELYGRAARHPAAAEKIKQLGQSLPFTNLLVPLVETLSRNANHYPDREVQRIAADTTRVVASRVLTQKMVTETDRVLKAVQHLAPGDRLLARDCQRFGQGRSLLPLPAPRPKPKKIPVCGRTIRLHGFAEGHYVETAATSGAAVFVAVKNRREPQVQLYRLTWREAEQLRLDWNVAESHPLLLATDPIRPNEVWLNAMGGNPFSSTVQAFGETNELPVVTRVVSRLTSALGVAMNGHGTTWIADIRDEMPTLSAIGLNGKLLQTVSLAEHLSTIDQYLTYGQPLPMFASGEHVYMGFGEQLVVHHRGLNSTTILDEPIIKITGSLPNTRRRTAVSLQQGAVLFWDDLHESGLMKFATDLQAPLLTFNRGGFVIAAWDRRCEIYSTKGNALNLVSEMELPKPAVEVISGDELMHFGVVYEDGNIDLFVIIE